MQALCGLQGIFDLFNCKTPGHINRRSGPPGCYFLTDAAERFFCMRIDTKKT